MLRLIMFKYKPLIVLCIVVFCALQADAAGDKNLVLYLPFDEGKGAEVKDLSDNGNHGVINGDVKWVDGKKNKALEFGGDIGQYVEVADSESLHFGKEPFAYMAWVKSNEFGDYQTVITKRHITAGDGNPTASLFINKTGTIFIEFRDSIQGMNAFDATDAVLKENTWYHVVWVKDDSELRVYVDGKLMQKVNHDRKGELTSTEPLRVGVHHYGNTWNDPFIGIIDEVAVFRSALNENDVRQFMNNILPVQTLGKLATTWGKLKR
ncbi:MAG: LamG domain-containing protein [Deltaproteobacteria bacterium]|nr:LamG domain-containing protein [Deltaproteobacteria bacterium]